MSPRFFATAADFGAWLAEHGGQTDALWLGYWKKGSGKPSMDWPQSVREALCVGWIDGVRKSLGEQAYAIRFTPRKARSAWSAVNIRLAQELIASGLMQPAGRRAFASHKAHPQSGYAFADRPERLAATHEKLLRANKLAWAWWAAQAPGYKRSAVFWVSNAKREETRQRRLKQLIDDCAAGRKIGPLNL